MSHPLGPRDIARQMPQLTDIDPAALQPLPHPYDTWEDPALKELSDETRERFEHSLDGVVGLKIERPDSDAARAAYVARFMDGLEKLLDREANWTFLQPLTLSLENCVKCNTCADACPVYESSGQNDAYRPLFRSETDRKSVV